MSSTFSGIELGKRGLQGHTQGLQTVGHNLSNASTEGYSRQRVEFRATDPLYAPQLNREERPGQIGQGMDTISITRIRDELLDTKITSSAHGQGYWEARDKHIGNLEAIHNEPADTSVRARLDAFWSSWQELSQNPSQLSHRVSLLQRGEALMDSIHNKYERLSMEGKMLDQEVELTTKEINTYLADIGKLNEEILKVEAMHDNPNDLYDRRDLLVDKLSKLLPITVEKRKDPDEFLIHTAGVHLVQGRKVTPINLAEDPNNEGYRKLVRPDTREDWSITGGKLGSLLELRDVDTRGEIQKLDMMTMHFTDLVNEVHQASYGLNGETGVKFFTEYPSVLNADGSFDRNGDGALDSSYIFRINGQHKLDPQQQTGLGGTITLAGPTGDIQINYQPTDTVQDIINRINRSGAEVQARLDREGRLQLKGGPAANPEFPDFVIRRVQDSGQFLSGYTGVLAQSGAAGAFTWDNPQAVATLGAAAPGTVNYGVAPLKHPSAWIGINPAVIADVGKIAAGESNNGRPSEAGNGGAALSIASIRNSQVMIGRTETFDDFFAATVADIAEKGQRAEVTLATETQNMKYLTDTRQSISGVNMDEELSNMLKFQHGYNATAKFISQWNDMLDTIINRLGV